MGNKLVHVQDAPFFSVKLGIKVLPCVVMFVNGVAVDRIVGFDGLGTKDDFPTAALETILLKFGVITREASAEDEESEQLAEHVRRSVIQGRRQLGSDDEDSDFSD